MLSAGGQVVLRVWGWQVPVALYVERYTDAPDPSLTPKSFEVSAETYQEMRRLLLQDGVVCMFDRENGRETMELSGVTIVARPAD